LSYLYETHLHTSLSSACGSSKGSEYIKGYIDLGYSGIFVTDHFFNGNTAISRHLPWKEWVHRFYQSYEEARNEGERQGLDVFFGWEESFEDGNDYLVYGLDKEWLLENPQARSWSRSAQYREVKFAGGCVVQAHPFRQHSYIRQIILTGCVDAVEAGNAANFDQSYDALALRYAKKMKLPYTAGSDIHGVNQLYEGKMFGVYLKDKIKTAADFVNAVCNGGIADIKVSEGRCEYQGNERPFLPVDIRGKNDEKIGRSLDFMWR